MIIYVSTIEIPELLTLMGAMHEPDECERNGIILFEIDKAGVEQDAPRAVRFAATTISQSRHPINSDIPTIIRHSHPLILRGVAHAGDMDIEIGHFVMYVAPFKDDVGVGHLSANIYCEIEEVGDRADEESDGGDDGAENDQDDVDSDTNEGADGEGEDVALSDENSGASVSEGARAESTPNAESDEKADRPSASETQEPSEASADEGKDGSEESKGE